MSAVQVMHRAAEGCGVITTAPSVAAICSNRRSTPVICLVVAADAIGVDVGVDDELQPGQAHAVVREKRQRERLGWVPDIHHHVRAWAWQIRQVRPLDPHRQPAAIDEAVVAFGVDAQDVDEAAHAPDPPHQALLVAGQIDFAAVNVGDDANSMPHRCRC